MATIRVRSNKNISEVVYTTSDTLQIENGATLTIDNTPAIRPYGIQCTTSGKLLVKNTSTTTPLILQLETQSGDYKFEGNAIFDVQGEMLVLGTGTGTQQTFDFKTLFNGAFTDIPTYIEVETGVDTNEYEIWSVVESEPELTTNIGNLPNTSSGSTVGMWQKEYFDALADGEETKVLFWSFKTHILSTGNGTTYGRVIPSGCKIRIPNIYIGNRWINYSAVRFYLKYDGTPTAGTFRMAFYNGFTGAFIGETTNIAYNATSAVLDATVESVLGTGTCTPLGGPLPSTWSFTLAGAYASTPVTCVISNSSITGCNIQILQYSSTDMTYIDLNPSGTGIFKNCMFAPNVRWANNAFTSIEMERVGVSGDGFITGSTNGRIGLNYVSAQTDPLISQITHNISNVLGDNCYVKNSRFLSVIAQAGLNMTMIPNLTNFDNNVVVTLGTGTSTSRYTLTLQSIPSLQINNLKVIGGEFNLVNSAGVSILGLYLSDYARAVNPNTYACNGMVLGNCQNILLYKVRNGGLTSARSTLIYPDAQSYNIDLLDIDYNCFNNSTGLLLNYAANTTVKDAIVRNARTSGIVQQSATYLSKNCLLKKIVGNYATASASAGSTPAGYQYYYNGVSAAEENLTYTHAGVSEFVGGLFYDESITPTKGHLSFYGFGSGSSLELFGGAYTDQIGSFYLPTAGDYCIATIPHIMHGITGFNSSLYDYKLIGQIQGKSYNHTIVVPNGADAGNTIIGVYNASDVLINTFTLLPTDTTSTVDTAITNALGTSTTNIVVTGTLTGGFLIVSLTPYKFKVHSNSLTLGGITSPCYAYARFINTALNGTDTFDTSAFTMEISLKTPTSDWTAWLPASSTNWQNALNSLTEYDPEVGLYARMKYTALIDNDFCSLNQVSWKVNIDLDKVKIYDASVNAYGTLVGETIEIKDTTTGSLLYSFVGGDINYVLRLGENAGKMVRFERYDANGNMIASSVLTPQVLSFGSTNPDVYLYAGNQIQLAQAPELAVLNTKMDTNNTTIMSGLGVINNNVKKASMLIPASEIF